MGDGKLQFWKLKISMKEGLLFSCFWVKAHYRTGKLFCDKKKKKKSQKMSEISSEWYFKQMREVLISN